VHGEARIVALPRRVLAVEVADQHEAHALAALARELDEPLESARALVGPDRAEDRDGRHAVVGQHHREPRARVARRRLGDAVRDDLDMRGPGSSARACRRPNATARSGRQRAR
jgi:hypothetical protein